MTRLINVTVPPFQYEVPGLQAMTWYNISVSCSNEVGASPITTWIQSNTTEGGVWVPKWPLNNVLVKHYAITGHSMVNFWCSRGRFRKKYREKRSKYQTFPILGSINSHQSYLNPCVWLTLESCISPKKIVYQKNLFYDLVSHQSRFQCFIISRTIF